MSRGIFSFCLILCCTSCLQHPYYCADLEVYDEWREDVPTSGEMVDSCWFTQLKDPILNALILEALENNQNLQVAIARIQEFYAQLGIVSSELYPQVDGNVGALRQRISMLVNALVPGTNPIFSLFALFASASYELDLWGKVANATEAALADLLSQNAACRTVLITLVADVAATYIKLKQYDKQLTISQQTEKSRQESFELAKYRFEGGVTSELPVKQAESEVQTAATEVLRLHILINQQENLLSILVGHAPRTIQRGESLDKLKLPELIPSDTPWDVITQRPDIQQAEQRVIAAHLRVDEARAELFPSLTLAGTYGPQSDTLQDLFTGPAQSWSYGLSLSQPFFHGSKIVSNIDRHTALEIEAMYNYEMVILNGLKEVEDALYAHQKSKELLVVQTKLVQVLQDYLRLATAQYDNGETDYLNVLDAERKLFTAELDYVEAQGTTFLTLIDLYRALGGGW